MRLLVQQQGREQFLFFLHLLFDVADVGDVVGSRVISGAGSDLGSGNNLSGRQVQLELHEIGYLTLGGELGLGRNTSFLCRPHLPYYGRPFGHWFRV